MGILAVDIGGTAVKSALFTLDGKCVQSGETPSNGKLGGPRLMRTVQEVIGAYEGYEAIGVSTTGQVNAREGTIVFANENVPNYTGMAVGAILSDAFHVPVAVENDVNAAALGEAFFGAGRGTKDFLCLTYGTGVGGAIVTGGGIYGGSTGVAGEIGHMVTHAGGRLCACGQRGCYEQYASVTALCRMAAAYQSRYQNGKQIFKALSADEGLRRVVSDWVGEMVIGLASLTHIFNPSLFVLGGGVLAQPWVLQEARRLLSGQIMPSYRGVRLEAAQLQNQAGVYGAMTLARNLLDKTRRSR